MRTSQFLLSTLKETPADAELISHQLMLRAAMIRKLGSGLYIWLPLGLRVLRKVESIIREEMNRAGAQELLMPAVQPAELWQKTGRWEKYGAELLKIYDRHEAEFCFGPTHEEVITELMRRELHSYKQLPANFYQIQTKFRDEIRPRFGVMRAREFLMKDAYSFHIDRDSLQETYQIMYEAYCRIFTRLGLQFRAVMADTGSIGGFASHEFQVLANNGEDVIAFSDESDYAANLEAAEAIAPKQPRPLATKEMQLVDTPGYVAIEQVSKFLDLPAQHCLKTLIVKNADGQLIALVLRGDHSLNPIKVEKLLNTPLVWATEQEISDTLKCRPGFIGPVGLNIPIIVDHSAANVADFVCGANQNDRHYLNVNWQRDVIYQQAADIRNVEVGDPSPDGKGHLSIARGIEVGHIFQLGQKYSAALNATVLDQAGKPVTLEMGCYGIGVSRIVAAAIEQSHDEKGIIWPISMAPFHVAIVPINFHKSERVKTAANALYQKLLNAGFEVLLDDRNERPGVMFADAELIGIPHRLVVSERGLDSETIEYKNRRDAESKNIALHEILEYLR